MGDVGTHHDIGAVVAARLGPLLPSHNFAFLLLGNLLTDLAQFRDPFAYIGAKQTVRRGQFLARADAMDDWLNDMFGAAEGSGGRKRKSWPRHGAFGTFNRHLCRAFVHDRFAKLGAIKAVSLPNVQPIAEAEIETHFQKAFTQYYPHEHVDLPPYRPEATQAQHKLYQPGPRQLIGYLEEQIEYVAAELLDLELALAASAPDIPASLIRLGHVLHAVEDFFFHSNHAEIIRWRATAAHLPSDPERTPEATFALTASRSLKGSADDRLPLPIDRHLRRVLVRRLRYPAYDFEGVPDPETSKDGTGFIFTGGFGSTDVFHTLQGALVGIEDIFATSLRLAAAKSQFVLVRTALDQAFRRTLVADTDRFDEALALHEKQLEEGRFTTAIGLGEAAAGASRLSASTADALRAAFTLDADVEARYDVAPGPGSFWMRLLVQMQRETDLSEQKTQELDRAEESVVFPGTVNGASGETIGTHSLLSKDRPEKRPMRDEAMALATFASVALAGLLLRPEPDRAKAGGRDAVARDWQRIVRHYLRFPQDRSASWESIVVRANVRGLPTPEPDAVADRPPPSFITQRDVDVIRRTAKREDLETRYRTIESRAESNRPRPGAGF